MAIEVTRQQASCGALIRGVDLTRALASEEVAEIRAAWLKYQVVAFPDQPMEIADIERFATYMGPNGEDPYIEAIAGHPRVVQVRREADEKTPIFAETWHSDWSFQDQPPAATLLLDALKGIAAVLIARQLGELAAVGAAAGAVLGHMFPVWLSFKGGKGMATALGVMWGLAWPVGAIACAAWLAFAAVFRYSSLATLLSVVVAAIAAWFLTDSRAAMLLTLLVPLVWARHHQNIARLLASTEPKIGQRGKAEGASTSGA